MKVKRNNPCPCGSGKKYKFCCKGKVDWTKIIQEGLDQKPYLSIRGRNILFLNKIAEALQFNSTVGPRSLKEYKAAFTSKAVKKIHEAILEIWPPDTDISNLLKGISADVSGLYIGDYRTDLILKGIVRHSLYSNKLLLVDPFTYPLIVKEEFNPILNPDKFRTQTLKSVNFWFALRPWIDEGIVEVIRTPADFNSKLNMESLQRQQKKYKENEELRKAIEVSAEEQLDRFEKEEAFRHLILSAPNSHLEKVFKDLKLDKNGGTVDQFIEYIERRRERAPDFLEPFGFGEEHAEYHIYTSGASYDIAKTTSNLTNSYLVTDIYSKWKEIELDRQSHNAENKEWAPFAKAFQGLGLKYLDNLRLEHALTLRKEERLESLRVFLRKVWRSACADNPFSEINVKLLADELKDEVRKAEQEWKQIDRNLLKWFGAELGTGLLAAGPLISSGHAEFLAAAIATAGTFTLASTSSQRRSFQNKFPAGFFIKLKK